MTLQGMTINMVKSDFLLPVSKQDEIDMKLYRVKIAAIAFLVFVIVVMWLFFYPTDSNQRDSIDNTTAILSEKASYDDVKEPARTTEAEVVVQDVEQKSVAEPIMSEADLIKLNDSVIKLQSELAALSLDLNENLEEPEIRKQIEAQYLRKTEEYNKALIAVVKSQQISSMVSE